MWQLVIYDYVFFLALIVFFVVVARTNDLQTEDRWRTAQWLALRSFKLAFLSVGGFLEKGEVYLATVRVLLHSRNFETIRHLERPMLNIIDAKTSWNSPEEVTLVANVYLMMFQIRYRSVIVFCTFNIREKNRERRGCTSNYSWFLCTHENRALKGELEEAIDIGIRVWKISEALHLNTLILTFVPSLIQIMVFVRNQFIIHEFSLRAPNLLHNREREEVGNLSKCSRIKNKKIPLSSLKFK